jgi:hypothetical protein
MLFYKLFFVFNIIYIQGLYTYVEPPLTLEKLNFKKIVKFVLKTIPQ